MEQLYFYRCTSDMNSYLFDRFVLSMALLPCEITLEVTTSGLHKLHAQYRTLTRGKLPLLSEHRIKPPYCYTNDSRSYPCSTHLTRGLQYSENTCGTFHHLHVYMYVMWCGVVREIHVLR